MLNFIRKIIDLYKSRHAKISDWYAVRFDENSIFMDVAPPLGKAYQDQLDWSDIERIVFEATDFMQSDTIYLFSKHRAESYAIPTEASGGNDLWDQILDRKLFGPELAIAAMLAETGYFVWPPET